MRLKRRAGGKNPAGRPHRRGDRAGHALRVRGGVEDGNHLGHHQHQHAHGDDGDPDREQEAGDHPFRGEGFGEIVEGRDGDEDGAQGGRGMGHHAFQGAAGEAPAQPFHTARAQRKKADFRRREQGGNEHQHHNEDDCPPSPMDI